MLVPVAARTGREQPARRPEEANMKKLFGGLSVSLVAVVAVVGLAGFACAHHGHPRDPAQIASMVNARVDDLLDDLDATPDQRTRIHAIADRLLASAKETHAGHDAARATVLAEWKADAPDRAKLHALVDGRIDEFRKLAHQAVDAGVEAHDVLTPAQREKLSRKAQRWHR
jgi:Spy/CpxP family protein refolding chaperone